MPATVIAAHPNQENYLGEFFLRESELPGGERLRAMRRAAIEKFAALGFPTTKNEDWKYTNLAPLLRANYERAPEIPAASAAHALARASLTEAACARLVFLNGRYAPELSAPPKGVRAGSLRDAFDDARLAAYADYDASALAALNTALFEDGAFVEIGAGVALAEPLEIVFASSAAERPAVTYPRALIVAGPDSQAAIIETYAGLGAGEYFTNAVTELIAGDGAVIEHYKLQTEAAGALHWGLLRVEQGASSNFTSHNVALGGALARNEIAVRLAGEGAECTLNGLYLAAGAQHIDNYTTLDHAQPHTTSHELYKGILDGNSQAVFHGRIIVRPEAQKTDAIQRNKNLLLSKDAVINTKPQLEIYADDVRCTHGATVGQVDADAVFYLRSRGIPFEEARNLLTYAFTADLVDAVKLEAVRSGLRDAMFRRLAGKQA